MKYFSFIRRDKWVEAIAPVTADEDSVSETNRTKEVRGRLNRPQLLIAGPAPPVVALSDIFVLGHRVRGAQNLISHTIREESTDLDAFAMVDQDTQDDFVITWSFPFPGSPICSVCTQNRIGNTSILDRQIFWTLEYLRMSHTVCSSCLMIANVMGKLLHAEAGDGLVCGRVEHFATDCRNLHEARRLWLFTTSFDQIQCQPKQSLGPRSYLKPEQPTSEDTLGCIQSFGSEGPSLFSGRYVSPDRTDFGLISGWLSTCESTHKAKCGRHGDKSQGAPVLRVVDVIRGCVVVASVDCRYFALSYVQPILYITKL